MFQSITNFIIDISKYKKINKIKSGGCAIVYLAEEIQTKQQCAAKVLTSCDINDEESKKTVDREIGIMMMINHPTIIKIYGFSFVDFQNDSNVTIFMELAKNGSLYDILDKSRQKSLELSNTNRQIILIGIARGIKYLHDRNIIHRDISTHNVLIDENLHPKITDFGFSKYFENDKSDDNSLYGGKFQYMAPEIIRGDIYNRKADVYSFGIVMYEVVTNLIPYPDFINKQITGFHLNLQIANNNHRPKFDNPIKESLKKLIEKCWSNSPQERPTFTEIFDMLTNTSNLNSEDSCILDNVDINSINSYIESITIKNDPVEMLIERSEMIEKELNDCKKEKESLNAKIDALEIFNKQLSNNLRKNKSFELDYPSESFAENYQKILDIKEINKYPSKFSITINIRGIQETDNNFEKDRNITCINIDKSVTSIKDFSFRGCTSLKQVFIPSSVKTIGENAFDDCTSLNQITIPSSVENPSSLKFSSNCYLKYIVPSSISEIGPFADIDNYEINELIDSRYNNALKATHKTTKDLFTLTSIEKSHLPSDWTQFYESVEISRIKLPGLLPIDEFRLPLSEEEKKKVQTLSFHEKDIFHKIDVDLTQFITIQKYMKNGNLEDLTKKYLRTKGMNKDQMNPTIRSKIIFGVACTMKQLHARNIIHRNLINKEIVLDDNFEPRIASFYFAKFVSSPKEDELQIGTIAYMAPEVNDFENYDGFLADVYAYSIFLYLMFEIDLSSFNTSGTEKFIFKIRCGLRPKKSPLIPDCYWDLIQKCWSQDPNERPTFAEITKILRDDKYALKEFGMETDLNDLHEYQRRIYMYK